MTSLVSFPNTAFRAVVECVKNKLTCRRWQRELHRKWYSGRSGHLQSANWTTKSFKRIQL